MIRGAFSVAVCLAVLGLVGLAQASPCPGTVCNAAFNSDDCCKASGYFPKFEMGARCSWRNTPVSFFYEGTCEGKGVKYWLLRSSNSQAQGQNLCRCKDPVPSTPVTLPAPKPTMPGRPTGYTLLSFQDIVGNDIPCLGKNFCEVCGSLEAVATRCRAYRCAAFTYNGKCGYLKKANGPNKYREGWFKYTRNT